MYISRTFPERIKQGVFCVVYSPQSLLHHFCSLISWNTNFNSEHVLRDVWEGTIIEIKMLILNQDASEYVNLLGSGGKNINSLNYMTPLLIFYPTLGQTLTTCNWDCYVNNRSQELVFGSLIKDIKALEASGITMLDGKAYKGTMCLGIIQNSHIRNMYRISKSSQILLSYR